MKVELLEYMGSDLNVVNTARVSFKKKAKWEVGDNDSYDLSEKDQKLIKYLAKEGHYSPFGHCFASFHVKTPIFVRSQLVKHEYLRMNEVSRRYVDDEPEFYTPEVWRGKAKDKKQGSEGEVQINYGVLKEAYCASLDAYMDMLEKGVAPEQARMVLPQAMYTEWIWSGSLDAFANMYNLRSKSDAQKETRDIALAIGKEMKEVFPHSWEALTNR
jgi:thymidylate synthase (FAD)